ncbi:MAG: tRNA-i(6)A37 thiotransferase enzyme MiaB [uncultured bacterium (gcode 4)]|uniref:tRNA-i(6)A37 thiotransferase enzyme MiaB n=1 Tax=uncultured bacterium (gcode 4) TaxID=1234023 RepID=K2G433_9BACT|nr:MAG: tRNA-i(6)A37 thiotransferase enzyme MiaB [uncultured bacterium (gcode 4)]
MEEIEKIDWIDRLRFTSSNPHDMTKDILDAHFDLKKTCNHMHFALQSWDDAILKNMNRKHTYSDFKAQVGYLRSRDPLFSISTDLIVGFPWETEDQFENTIKAMKEILFDFVYIARYSWRPGTFADKQLPDDVSSQEKARRWHILNDMLEENVRMRSELMIWRTEEILIQWISKWWKMYWRTRNFKEVYFEENKTLNIWDIVPVKIEKAIKWILEGKSV